MKALCSKFLTFSRLLAPFKSIEQQRIPITYKSSWLFAIYLLHGCDRHNVDPPYLQPSQTGSAGLPSAAATAKSATASVLSRSSIWQGFDRFSRRLTRRGARNSSTGSAEDGRSAADAAAACAAEMGPCTSGGEATERRHPNVHRTSSSAGEDRTKEAAEEDLEHTATAGRAIGSAGSRRRQIFASGKQYSMPAEVVIPTPNPNPIPIPMSPKCGGSRMSFVVRFATPPRAC